MLKKMTRPIQIIKLTSFLAQLIILYVQIVVWPMLFSLIFADVLIRHPRIIKAELKTRTLTFLYIRTE